MMDQLARRYPIAMPTVGLVLAGGASVSLLLSDSGNGKMLSLIAAAGALLNAWVLFRHLGAKRTCK